MPIDLLPGRAKLPLPAQRIFCNRTLNLRSIQAIGFDMDYTLVHYHQDRVSMREDGADVFVTVTPVIERAAGHGRRPE